MSGTARAVTARWTESMPVAQMRQVFGAFFEPWPEPARPRASGLPLPSSLAAVFARLWSGSLGEGFVASVFHLASVAPDPHSTARQAGPRHRRRRAAGASVRARSFLRPRARPRGSLQYRLRFSCAGGPAPIRAAYTLTSHARDKVRGTEAHFSRARRPTGGGRCACSTT